MLKTNPNNDVKIMSAAENLATYLNFQKVKEIC